MTFSRSHARATDAERAWFASQGAQGAQGSQGAMSETATMRTMARRTDASEQALIELKAVDGAYPLSGVIRIEDGRDFRAVLREPMSAAVEPILLERLGLKVGDRIAIGRAELTVAARIAREPDGLADRLTYGPRVLVTMETLAATELIQPGTLVRWRYALKLPNGGGASASKLTGLREASAKALPEAGFTISDRRDPSPQVTRTIDRLRQFLTLIGMTALIVGGVGVANAVATFIDKRRKVIATFKSLGATNGSVLAIFLVQVLLMALIGVVAGLALGLAVPPVVQALLGDSLPIRMEPGIALGSVMLAVAYGVIVAALFAVWPLGRAEQVSPAILFRDEIGPETGLPNRRIRIATALLALALVALAVLTSDSQRIALMFCGVLGVILALFSGLGNAVTWAAGRLPRPRVPELALAIGNVARPGGLTRSIVLSLGAGLSLLVHRIRAQGAHPGAVAELLRARRAERRDRRADQGRARRGAGCGVRIGADAARPDREVEGQGAGGDEGRARGAVGARGRPRAHLCRGDPGRLAPRQGRVVEQGLCRRAAGVVRG
jgi:putative ABC transport system permease protein